MNAFDISDESFVDARYERPFNMLTYDGINSETFDNLSLFSGTAWALHRPDGSELAFGTYSVVPGPEPSPLLLVLPIVEIGGLRLRHQRLRA
jgi:hypothetical protein